MRNPRAKFEHKGPTLKRPDSTGGRTPMNWVKPYERDTTMGHVDSQFPTLDPKLEVEKLETYTCDACGKVFTRPFGSTITLCPDADNPLHFGLQWTAKARQKGNLIG